jgi:hypothetical protein
VVRTSLFRSPYELLFVAMDPSTRHRAKAMLDVICARAGDALGSGIVQDLQTLRDLRSRDPARVTAALARLAALGRSTSRRSSRWTPRPRGSETHRSRLVGGKQRRRKRVDRSLR